MGATGVLAVAHCVALYFLQTMALSSGMTFSLALMSIGNVKHAKKKSRHGTKNRAFKSLSLKMECSNEVKAVQEYPA